MRRNLVKDWIYVGLFAALTWVGAYIRFPLLPDVPLTLQTLIVVLSGLVLGARRAFLSQAVYIVLGLVGVPVFAQGGAGIGYIVKPTFGFILGFLLGAVLAGWVDYGLRRLPIVPRSILAAIAGMIGVYLVGLPYLHVVRLWMGNALPFGLLAASMIPFAIGDLIKAVLLGLIRPALAKGLPDLNSSC